MYRKIRYSMSPIRKDQRLAKALLSQDLHKYSQLSPPQASRFARQASLKNVKHCDAASHCFLRDFAKEARHLQIVRFYSSSERDAFKGDAPVGIFEEAQSSFHLSSLGGRLGQSFNRLSRHINVYFKRTDAVALAENATLVVTTPEYLGRPQRRRQSHRAASEPNVSESKDTAQTLECKSKQKNTETSSSPQELSALQLFHISSLATRFGESYSYVAHHINSVFSLGFAKHQDDLETVSSNRGINRRQKRRKMQNTYIRNMKEEEEEPTQITASSEKAAVEPNSLSSTLVTCIEALNEHLIRYPSCKALIWQEKTAVTLLRQRRTYRYDHKLQAAVRETLALIGYVDPVKGRGIRVLSIDGGGTRGVVPLQLLKLLEDETGKKVHQLFDYICGVSTGAVLAFMLGLARFSLEECADMYRRFGSEVFRQNPLVGTVKMGWSHSYYNTETWETILLHRFVKGILFASPQVSAVSAVVNWGTSPKAFVFRNYNHKPGSLCRYAGASGCQVWQAVRASSAAPGYFQEFTLQSDIHQDGGILLNNPCALAVHESRLLWPNQHFQCVLSLGTGRYDNVKRGPATSTSLRAKISNLICSATDTEGVHTLLDDLLAPDVYFRFNPMLSAQVSLDENRPGALDLLQRDTQNYLERNRNKLARLCLPSQSCQSPSDPLTFTVFLLPTLQELFICC
uniref:Calcium-independent phospholipase A2-gamma-like n=1 Tax=Stegastes partitus TaxID=144197 RepID=A0A3B5B4X8_9TELE